MQASAAFAPAGHNCRCAPCYRVGVRDENRWQARCQGGALVPERTAITFYHLERSASASPRPPANPFPARSGIQVILGDQQAPSAVPGRRRPLHQLVISDAGTPQPSTRQRPSEAASRNKLPRHPVAPGSIVDWSRRGGTWTSRGRTRSASSAVVRRLGPKTLQGPHRPPELQASPSPRRRPSLPFEEKGHLGLSRWKSVRQASWPHRAGSNWTPLPEKLHGRKFNAPHPVLRAFTALAPRPLQLILIGLSPGPGF